MLMQVDISAAKATLRLRNGFKRMVYTVVNATNDVGLQVQAAIRQRLQSTYSIRKPFALQQVKFIRASVGLSRWEARVGIGIGKQPSGSPFLLPQFEVGGQRRGFKGGAVAVPVIGGARPSQAQAIPDALFIQRLALRRPTRGRPKKHAAPVRAGTLVRKGLLGTYQVQGVGIFQRISAAATRSLYLFKPTIRLPRNLAFYQTATSVITSQFAPALQRQVNEAFARQQ